MNTKKLTKKQEAEIKSLEAQNYLLNLFSKSERAEVKTIIRSVSKSGMSRSISFYYADENITFYVAEALGEKLSLVNGYNAIKVSGCGMDTGFKVVYDLSVTLYCPDKYDHDSAYRLKQRWL